MAEHARFSPSSFHRLFRCHASLLFAEKFPNESSKYADEGTAAHGLCSALVSGELSIEKAAAGVEAGTLFMPTDRGPWKVDKFMLQHAIDFKHIVEEYAGAEGMVLVEQKVDFSRYIKVDGQTGTADVIIVFPTRLVIIDFKYGIGVPVAAENHEQMRGYALGAVNAFEDIIKIEKVTMVIVQPRIGDGRPSEWTVDLPALLAFGADLADMAEACLDEFAEFTPGEVQCKFCPAAQAAGCKALQDHTSAIHQADFAMLDDPGLSSEELGALFDRITLTETFMKGVRAEVERRLFRNEPVVGGDGPYKLVEGKLGDRKWMDEETVVATMQDNKIVLDDIYDKKVVSPATVDKKWKKTNPELYKKLSGLWNRSPGKPSVAPASDKRPAITVGAEASDFADLPSEE